MQEAHVLEKLTDPQFRRGIAVRGLQAQFDLSIPWGIARRTLDAELVIVTSHAKLDIQDGDAPWVAE